MEIKKCTECNEFPELMCDEFGMIYSYECPICHKRTFDLMSPSSKLFTPHLDEDTKSRLVDKWNEINSGK